MSDFTEALRTAALLIVHLDPELRDIVLLSLACRTGRQLDGPPDAGAGGGPGGATGGAAGGMAAGGMTGAGGLATGGAGGVTGPGTGGVAGGTGGSTGPAMLTGSTTHVFGVTEVSVASPPFTWTVGNSGGSPSPVPTLINGDPDELVTTNHCTAAIAPGANCTVDVAFRATTSATRQGTLTVNGGTAGQAILIAQATGAFRLTVVKSGAGTGTVSGAAALAATTNSVIDCGTICSGLFYGTVNLQARTTNGSASFFSGWAGGLCEQHSRDCPAFLQGPTTVTATFSQMNANLVFVTSTIAPTNQGSAATYDSNCNASAMAAGINTAASDGYTAMISDANSLARARLGATARGWVRMDGKPFADTQTALFDSQVVFNDVRFDELHNVLIGELMTGTASDGTLTPLLDSTGVATCNNWTDASAGRFFSIAADSAGGAGNWLSSNLPYRIQEERCSGGGHLLCMGNKRNTVVTVSPSTGKKIWVSNSLFNVTAGMTPDALCQANRPTGVSTAVALIATTTRAAGSVLDMSAIYTRPDGTMVGTGAEIVTYETFGNLESGPWQFGDGTYMKFDPSDSALAWTGQTDLMNPGGMDTTCSNWTVGTGYAIAGNPGESSPLWWNGTTAAPCSQPHHVYCVQTAP